MTVSLPFVGEFLQQSQLVVRPDSVAQIVKQFDDGQRLMNGTLPTLVQWGDVHPTQHMAASGVTLQSLTASQPDAQQLRAAYAAIGLDGVAAVQGPANLTATLSTPRGLVTLQSHGL